MLRVGLTGGIASGKTRVRARLAEEGLTTFDLDDVARTVTERGRPAHADIVRSFGPSVLGPDGRIDRGVLGGIVFSDAEAREHLNAIVHPRVFEEEEVLLEQLPPDRRQLVVTDATLLVESGYHVRFDRLVATWCRPVQQLDRLMTRDGYTLSEASARVAAQMPGGEKASYAHRVIDTSGTEEQTDAAARLLARELRELAALRPAPMVLELRQVVGCLAAAPGQGPRGLSPSRVAEMFARHGAPPFAAMARAMTPPWIGPWYEASRAYAPGAPAETLMGPAVLWSLGWHGPDDECTLATAVSIARLTHHDAEAQARAGVVALALLEVARSGMVPADLAARVARRGALVERWTGRPPAAADLRELEGAGVVRGLAEGLDPAAAPAEIAGAAQGLVRAAGRRRS